MISLDSLIDNDPRLKVAVSRRILGREGCESQVAGHVSLRASDASSFWVSPFEYFDESEPERVIRTDLDRNVLEGSWTPSPAIDFHAKIYRDRPDVKAVIHTHSHYACVLATTGRLLGMYNDASALFLDEQVLHVDDGLSPPVDGDTMSSELGHDKNVILIKNHGAIFVADSLETATILALTFEKCAHIHVEAEMIGGTEHPRAYVEKGKVAYHQYYIPQMWAANVRRLYRDEPQLFSQSSTHGAQFAQASAF